MGDVPCSVHDLEQMAQASQEIVISDSDDADAQPQPHDDDAFRQKVTARVVPSRWTAGGSKRRKGQGHGDDMTASPIGDEEGHKLLYKGGLLKRTWLHREQRAGTSNATQQEQEPECSGEQQRAVDAVLTGKSVFITGGAGVGKSFLVRKIVKELTTRGRRIQVCASTGVAAVQINGQTLNSFAGIGLAQETKEVLAEQCYKAKRTRKRWKNVDVLLIDEISMISCELFDKVDYVCKRCRGAEVNGRALFHREPMGGIQVIAVGDFFQLPPVNHKDTFAFDSGAWKALDFVKVILTRVWRQRDPEFVNILNEIRIGKLSQRNLSRLRTCNRPLPSDDGILATKLYPVRRSVDSENKKYFDRLEGTTRTYTCDDFASSQNAEPYLRLLEDIGVAGLLDTRLRMQVMLKSNLDISSGLCNGSRGVIIGYQPFHVWRNNAEREGDFKMKYSGALARLNKWGKKHHLLPLVLFANGIRQVIPPSTWDRSVLDGKAAVTRLQIPLIPAWALTIHKSQGMSLDRVQINLVDVFSEGQTYVALSRARSLEGLQLMGLSQKSVKVSQKVLEYYNVPDSSLPEDDHTVNGRDANRSANAEKPWSNEFEAMIYDVVKLNMQSAMTQAIGYGLSNFDSLKNSFLAAAERACQEVIQECQDHFDKFPHKACIPSTPKDERKRQKTSNYKQSATATQTKPKGSTSAASKRNVADVVGEIDSDCTQDYDQEVQPTQKYSGTQKGGRKPSGDGHNEAYLSQANWIASQQVDDSDNED